jgi:hypothetical protein
MHEVAEIQGSTSTLNSRIEEEKEFRHQSLNQQRGYEESLKQLVSDEGLGSRMGIELYDERSMLRDKIANEKEKRRKSQVIQKLLSQEKDEVTASVSGKPTPNNTRTQTRLPFKKRPMVTEASSSGRVRVPTALAGSSSKAISSLDSFELETDNSHPGTGNGTADEWEQGMPFIQALWQSFPDNFPSVAEQLEERDDPEACLDESSSHGATREYGEAKTSTSASNYSFIHPNTNLSVLDSESIFPSQGLENEVLYTNYTLNGEFPTSFYTYNSLT